MNDYMRRDMTVGRFLVVTFWKFAKILVQNWEMNLTWIKDTEMIVMMRVSCD